MSGCCCAPGTPAASPSSAAYRAANLARFFTLGNVDTEGNPTAWGYSPYGDIIKKLIAAGIPAEQIAVMGDAESDAKKQVLFEKVRQGSVRVLIGSTQKMGTGTNVQKRLVALHHLDAPWKPAEVEQREGRILRQGNTNEEVAIYRYVTEGSFDAYMWQALETKARFISQVITGDNAARRAEDSRQDEAPPPEWRGVPMTSCPPSSLVARRLRLAFSTVEGPAVFSEGMGESPHQLMATTHEYGPARSNRRIAQVLVQS